MTLTLSYTPIQTGYSSEEIPGTIYIPLEGGTGRRRQDILLNGHIVNCQWLLKDKEEYTRFMGFFITDLRYGVDDFLLDLYTDIGVPTTHKCRTIGGLPRLTQQKGDAYWATCQIECDKNPTFTDTIVYTTSAGDGIAWIFDGINDNISFGDVLDKDITDSFSIFGWVDSPGPSGALLSKQGTASSTGWRFTASCNWIMVSSTAGQIQVGPTTAPSANSLHQVGMTYDGSGNASGVTLWLDGVDVTGAVASDNISGGNSLNTQPLRIGLRGSSLPVLGTLAHVSLWDKKLTAGEVTEVYNAGIFPDLDSVSCAANLDLWIKLDSNDTSDPDGVIDHGPDGIDGTSNFDPTQFGVVGAGEVIYENISKFFKEGDFVRVLNTSGVHPDGNVPLNLDGVYEVMEVTSSGSLYLDNPSTVNDGWTTLYNIDPVDLAEYGGLLTGNVLSTVTKVPT